MRYAIITNPISGRMTVHQKRAALGEAASILNAEIFGLDTATTDDLAQCARELAARFDVLVTAGGDGTFSDIINAIDTARTPVAFLPLGSGNAMRHALNYRGSMTDIATRIRKGKIHECDLINCGKKKRAYLVSVGIEGSIISLRERYLTQGSTGFKAYALAVLHSYFREYKRTVAKITTDERTFEVKNLLSFMVVKQPYYGYGMKVVPKARFNDRRLHMLCVNSGLLKCFLAAASAFTIGNRTGIYQSGQHVTIALERALMMQADGNAAWSGDAFTFSVLPSAMKIKC
jgi:diacylglycerol kinase (ATP)